MSSPRKRSKSESMRALPWFASWRSHPKQVENPAWVPAEARKAAPAWERRTSIDRPVGRVSLNVHRWNRVVDRRERGMALGVCCLKEDLMPDTNERARNKGDSGSLNSTGNAPQHQGGDAARKAQEWGGG